MPHVEHPAQPRADRGPKMLLDHKVMKTSIDHGLTRIKTIPCGGYLPRSRTDRAPKTWLIHELMRIKTYTMLLAPCSVTSLQGSKTSLGHQLMISKTHATS